MKLLPLLAAAAFVFIACDGYAADKRKAAPLADTADTAPALPQPMPSQPMVPQQVVPPRPPMSCRLTCETAPNALSMLVTAYGHSAALAGWTEQEVLPVTPSTVTAARNLCRQIANSMCIGGVFLPIAGQPGSFWQVSCGGGVRMSMSGFGEPFSSIGGSANVPCLI